MSTRNEIPYETVILNLLTNERYQLAEVIARHSRATGVSLEEADEYIKGLIGNPISNLRVADVDDLTESDDADEESDFEAFRAQIATQTLLAATTMLNSNIPSPPMQERLRRLAHAAVEDLELFYFGEEDEDDHEGHDHHNHGPHEHRPH